MAGISGKSAYLAFKKQTARASVATTAAAFKVPFSGGSIGPVRETDRLSETDTSRDQGNAYVTTSGVEGTPEIYVRPVEIGALLQAALGSDAISGLGPYVHTITPTNSLPYYTFWRNVGDTVYERFEDVFVSSLTVSAGAGEPLTASFDVQGRRAVLLDSAGADSADVTTLNGLALANTTPFSFNDATVRLGGITDGTATTSLVSSFEVTIENNVSRQQTDDVTPYDVSAGTREVSLGFDMIFNSIDEYRKFHYNNAYGAVSSTIYNTAARFDFVSGANTLRFDFDSIAYEEFPVEPDPGGDPIVVSVRAAAQKGASPVVTATLTNTRATVY